MVAILTHVTSPKEIGINPAVLLTPEICIWEKGSTADEMSAIEITR